MHRRTRAQVKQLDLTRSAATGEVLALQRAAYAVEAELIGFDGIPPLHESVPDLVGRRLTWLGISDADGLAAAIAYDHDDSGCLVIDRLMVAPRAFRRGFGRALVEALLAHEAAATVLVSTGARNQPALALYAALGFQATGQREVSPGVEITLLRLDRA